MDSNRFNLSPDSALIFNNKNDSEWISQYAPLYEQQNNQSWISLIKKGEYMPLARYAEVILLAAENNVQTGKLQEALASVNRLRARNSRPLLEPESSSTQISEAILEEYKLDLGKEGLYFPALKRFDKAESVLNIASYQKYLPVPYQEIIINPTITQNAGY
jgi:tetratricopeptide (TPR) repeat protein